MPPCLSRTEAEKRKKDVKKFLRLTNFDRMKALPLSEKVEYSKSVIKKAIEEHGDNCCIACSFGKNSTIMVHLVREFLPDARVVFANTGVEMPETIEFRDFLVKEWNLNYIELKPIKSFWQCVKEYGYPVMRSMSEFRPKGKEYKRGSPACCAYLKEKPFDKFYKSEGIKAVFVGLTWDESYTRRMRIMKLGDYHMLAKGYVKVLPIAYWSEKDIWDYIRQNDLPVNSAYEKKGIKRTGCIVCTGYLSWKQEMAKTSPKLLKKIMRDMGETQLDDFDDFEKREIKNGTVEIR